MSQFLSQSIFYFLYIITILFIQFLQNRNSIQNILKIRSQCFQSVLYHQTMHNMQNMQTQQLFAQIKSIFPILQQEATKGQNGRIGVIGGSYQFSGPPYYAAISALKVGTDMAHIFCPKTSATAIKSYSPQLIVHPVFDLQQDIVIEQQELQTILESWLLIIKKWYKDIYSWVIGPGLGRDKYINLFFPRLVKNLPEDSVVVFDADGIYYLCQNPQLFSQLKRYKAIITPNKGQLELIEKVLKIQIQSKLQTINNESQIFQFDYEWKFPFTLFIKGIKDFIIGNNKNFVISIPGGLKRSANIGDILAGSVSACALWDFTYGPALASIIVRMATKKGYEKEGRSLTALCIISQIVETIKVLQTQPPFL